jgi:hypothetical protein
MNLRICPINAFPKKLYPALRIPKRQKINDRDGLESQKEACGE